MGFLPSGSMGLATLGIVILLLVAGVLVFISPQANARNRMRQRMLALSNPNDADLDEFDETTLLRKTEKIGYFAALMTRAGGARALPLIILGALAAATVTAVATTFVLRPPFFVPLFAAAVVSPAGAMIVLNNLIMRREQAFLSAFPDAIDLIVRAVRAGIPVGESIQAVGEEAAEPVASEFRTLAEQTSLGIDMGDALTDAAQRVSISDFNFFVVSLLLQRETGGGLAETLENLSRVVRKRKEQRLKIKALTSEGRMSAKIVAGIPLLAIGALMFMQPDYLAPLVNDQTGRLLLAAAIGSITLGMFVINRITRMPQ